MLRVGCLRRASTGDSIRHMELQDRLVLVPAGALDDMLELARTLADRMPHDDPLALALRGSIGQVRSEIVMEP